MKAYIKYLVISTVLLTFLICHTTSYGQPIGSDDCDYNDPAIPCPIDGGLTALLAVGAIYGIKKVKDSRKS